MWLLASGLSSNTEMVKLSLLQTTFVFLKLIVLRLLRNGFYGDQQQIQSSVCWEPSEKKHLDYL